MAATKNTARASDGQMPVSGVYAVGVGRLRAAMLRHISPILVDSVLARAVEAHRDQLFSSNMLHAVAQDCMIGLRLFVKAEELPSLMLELAQILDEEE